MHRGLYSPAANVATHDKSVMNIVQGLWYSTQASHLALMVKLLALCKALFVAFTSSQLWVLSFGPDLLRI